MKDQRKKVTKIQVQKKSKNRVNIYLDNEFAISCNVEIIYLHNIKVEMYIDSKYLMEIINEDEYIKGKSAALKIIEKSYKTEKQIYDKLKTKGYSEDIIKKILLFLKEYKFVDDIKFTNLYIREKIKYQGRNKIKYSLIKKGVPEYIINEEIRGIDENVEKNSALKLGEKKYNSLIKNEKDFLKIYKKLGNYLVRNGYEYNIVKVVLKDIINLEDLEEKREKDNSLEDLYKIANKRYNIIKKSQKDSKKIYEKLATYLVRKGYKWDIVKKVVNNIIKDK